MALELQRYGGEPSAQVRSTGVNWHVLFLAIIVVVVDVVTKLVGCGLPAMIFLKVNYSLNYCLDVLLS